MILYNVTVKIALDVHEDWLKWMKEKHIPDVLATGFFETYRMAKILGLEDEEEGLTYSIQYETPSMEVLNNYLALHAPALQKEHSERYKNKFVAFRSLMELV